MFKIEGLDSLSQQLDEAQRAFAEIEGDLGSVHFDPHDPASIEAAIQEAHRLVDVRMGGYQSNALVAPLIEQLKEGLRENIVERAASARLSGDAQ